MFPKCLSYLSAWICMNSGSSYNIKTPDEKPATKIFAFLWYSTQFISQLSCEKKCLKWVKPKAYSNTGWYGQWKGKLRERYSLICQQKSDLELETKVFEGLCLYDENDLTCQTWADGQGSTFHRILCTFCLYDEHNITGKVRFHLSIGGIWLR